jgi:DNA invertase Pin-like site-specific DNA recombinase
LSSVFVEAKSGVISNRIWRHDDHGNSPANAKILADNLSVGGDLSWLTMLAAVAQLERAFILAGTYEGRVRAKSFGRRFGPKPKLTGDQVVHARELQREGRGLREIGKLLGCSASTVSRALQALEDVDELGPVP